MTIRFCYLKLRAKSCKIMCKTFSWHIVQIVVLNNLRLISHQTRTFHNSFIRFIKTYCLNETTKLDFELYITNYHYKQICVTNLCSLIKNYMYRILVFLMFKKIIFNDNLGDILEINISFCKY